MEPISKIKLPEHKFNISDYLKEENSKIILIDVWEMPEKKGSKQSYFLYSSNMKTYHRFILCGFLDEYNITYKNKDQNFFPEANGTHYEVICMGRSYINREDKEIVFSGASSDYGLGIKPDHKDIFESFFKDQDFEIKIN